MEQDWFSTVAGWIALAGRWIAIAARWMARVLPGWIALACVVASVGSIPYYNYRQPIGQNVIPGYFRGEAPRFGNWVAVDEEIRSQVPEGNIAMRFINFPLDYPRGIDWALRRHVRGNYGLYPRRVICAEESTIINRGIDLFNTRFSPTPQWLRERQVTATVNHIVISSGDKVIDVEKVPPAPVDRNGGR